MKIEKITAVLRPRNNWEAIDLGFNMANFWFTRLWLLWMISALPVFVICNLMFYNYPYLAGMLVWWLKPIYELPLLYFLSRALFGEYQDIKATRGKFFQIIKPLFIPLLSWRRFSLSRSFNNPVQLLEGLTGKKRRERIDVLNFKTNGTGQWLTIICIHFEIFLYFSIIGLVYMLIPEEIEWFDLELLLFEDSIFVQVISNLIYFFVLSLIAPFYTAAGFSLYLARRTELEGWDIELGFKKLNNRIHSIKRAGAVTTALTLLCFLYTLPESVYAQDLEIENAKIIIEEVVSRDEFGKLETHTIWRPILQEVEETNDWDLPDFIEDFFKAIGNLFAWIGNLFTGGVSLLEALLWVSVLTLLILLLLRFRLWSQWMGGNNPNQDKNPIKPAQLFGLEVSENNLPDDIFTEVQKLLSRGELRLALSMLYRASLIQLIHLHQLEIPESATEGECLRIVKSHRPDDEASFFYRLTRIWLHLAYAHELPDGKDLDNLSKEWQSFYGTSHES